MPPDIKESFRVATLLTGVPPTDLREVNRVFRTNPAEIISAAWIAWLRFGAMAWTYLGPRRIGSRLA
jgi:hypothetical protein